MKSIVTLGLCLLTLSGCAGSKFEPILVDYDYNREDFNLLEDQDVFKLYKEKYKNDEKISKLLYLEMDQEYPGKELFVLSHTKKNTYFKVFSFNKDTEKFTKIFKKETDYNPKREFYVHGVIPLKEAQVENVLIGQYTDPTLVYTYLLIGGTAPQPKIHIIIDNALKENNYPVVQGGVQIDSDGITVLTNSEFLERHYISEGAYKSTKDIIPSK